MKQNQKNRQQQRSVQGKNEDSQKNQQPSTEPSVLEKFFVDQLKDMYYCEKKIIEALPKMATAATTEELQDAFEYHLEQTKKQVKRLEKVFMLIKKEPEAQKCEAIEGIIKEAEEIIEETQEGTMTRDAALIIAAQKVEHYEIATYGGLVQLAITMNLDHCAHLLDKTLQEEEDTDTNLTDIAEEYINVSAEQEKPYSWENRSYEMYASTPS